MRWFLIYYLVFSALASAVIILALLDPRRVPWLELDISRRHPTVHLVLTEIENDPVSLFVAWLFWVVAWPILLLAPEVRIRLKAD